MYIIAYITAFVKRDVQFRVHYFAKPLEKSCQVWYNITVRISAQKTIDNKHPLISGTAQEGSVGKSRAKMAKNSLIINAPYIGISPLFFFRSF